MVYSADDADDAREVTVAADAAVDAVTTTSGRSQYRRPPKTDGMAPAANGGKGKIDRAMPHDAKNNRMAVVVDSQRKGRELWLNSGSIRRDCGRRSVVRC